MTDGNSASKAVDVPSLDVLKAEVRAGREAVRQLHDAGRPAGQVVAALTNLCDAIVQRAYRRALDLTPAQERPAIVKDIALVAVGGYGRQDLAPFSDVDLLFLLTPGAAACVKDFAARLVRDLWDAGLYLSQSVRTPAECIAGARQDLTLRTTLVEARLLIGGSAHFAELQRRVHRLYQSSSINRFIAEALTERAKEHQDYHTQTVYLLEPNVKKSPGGLRDYHMLRWVALARHGITDPNMLGAGRILSPDDAETLSRVTAFLQRLRNEMHFFAGAAQDVLTREEQIRLATWAGFEDVGQLFGVERFMRHYYRETSALNDVVMRFIAGARRTHAVDRALRRMATRRVEGRFLLDREHLAIVPEVQDAVLADMSSLLQMFDLARGYGVHVDHATLELVRAAVPGLEMTAAAREKFLAALANPSGLGFYLRNLHRVGLLSRLLPPFEHARCLIQFNVYHKYTVDEHSLRAVEAATQRADERSPLGQAYREIRRKDLLHLAILLHDLGKGLGEDHCEVGRQLAAETAAAFGLSEHEGHMLALLVHRHLLMAHTAFRRDLSDAETLLSFAREVATAEALRMLYVLTAADTEAVAPENWSTWKETLLNELYFRAVEVLTGEAVVADEATRRANLEQELATALPGDFPADWLLQQLSQMPMSYLLTTEADQVAAHLRVLSRFDRPVHVESRFVPETGFVEFTVFTRDDLISGIFSRIAGVLAAMGVQIVSARIVTRPDQVVIDTFYGQDLTFAGEPPPGRREEVGEQIAEVLLGRVTVESLFARRGRPMSVNGNGMLHQPPRVEIDNATSARFSIIEVFADDRLGRLYAITRALWAAGLSVASAKINTYGDQIADVFYVTTQAGEKLTGEAEMEAMRTGLLAALAEAHKAASAK